MDIVKEDMCCFCKKCGKYNYFKAGTRFPICKFCDNDTFAPVPGDEIEESLQRAEDKIPNYDPTYNGHQAECESNDELREKYVFPLPEFDKVAYNKMRKAEDEEYERFHREMMEFDREIEARHNGHPKCPTCGSFNTRKITALSKAASVGLFGIFSQKVKRQFHCDSCGYEW